MFQPAMRQLCIPKVGVDSTVYNLLVDLGFTVCFCAFQQICEAKAYDVAGVSSFNQLRVNCGWQHFCALLIIIFLFRQNFQLKPSVPFAAQGPLVSQFSAWGWSLE